ncbi:hypothetical protein M0804_002554 [Polistes exclamans]|nr:hypothetical protein M0804_002554 [Polistes exclamans]
MRGKRRWRWRWRKERKSSAEALSSTPDRRVLRKGCVVEGFRETKGTADASSQCDIRSDSKGRPRVVVENGEEKRKEGWIVKGGGGSSERGWLFEGGRGGGGGGGWIDGGCPIPIPSAAIAAAGAVDDDGNGSGVGGSDSNGIRSKWNQNIAVRFIGVSEEEDRVVVCVLIQALYETKLTSELRYREPSSMQLAFVRDYHST